MNQEQREAAQDAADAKAKAARADARESKDGKAGKDAPESGEKGYDPTTRPGYQEYPKVVDGVTVDSKEAEAALKSGDGPKVVEPKGTLPGPR